MSLTVDRVLIVGGGVGGMSLAIKLREARVQVVLIDVDPNWRVYGAGITISGPSWRSFESLGILEEAKAQGSYANSVVLADPQGNFLTEIDTPSVGGPHVPGGGGILRPTLHRILSNRVTQLGTDVRLGISVERLDQDDTGVLASFSDGSSERFDIVVGADGLISQIRKLIFPEAPKPQFTGQGCWRLLAARPPEIDRAHIYIGGPVRLGVTPVSPTQMYLWLLQNVPDNPWIKEDELVSRLETQLTGFGGLVVAIRRSVSAGSSIIYRPLEKIILPKPWHVGRVMLIGDAAHATTPHLASGAGLAVEDALVLAEELGAADTIETAFTRHVERRYERCRLVVENSVRLGELEGAASNEEFSLIMRESMAALAGPI